MTPFYRLLPVLVITTVLAGCAAPPAFLLPDPPETFYSKPLPLVEQPQAEPSLYQLEAPDVSLLTADIAVFMRLRQAYEIWEGTPYRFGGMSRSGIDCSAFVQTIFSETLDFRLTRSTSTQVREGQEIPRAQLRTGDLVFFRTGRTRRHVGIYLGDGQFMHASTRRGVTIDNINTSAYYNSAYWTARRVLDDEMLAQFVPPTGPQFAQRTPVTPHQAPEWSRETEAASTTIDDRRAGW